MSTSAAEMMAERFFEALEAGRLEGSQAPAGCAMRRSSNEIDCADWWNGLADVQRMRWSSIFLASTPDAVMASAWKEYNRRLNAVSFARASVGLEGFKPSQEVEAEMRRFVNAEIDIAEFVKPVR